MPYKTKSLEYITAVKFAELATLAETCVSPNSPSRGALSAAKVIDCVIEEVGWLVEDKVTCTGFVRAATHLCKVSTQEELVSTREELRNDALSARQLLRDVVSSGVNDSKFSIAYGKRPKHPSKECKVFRIGMV
ncbi:hypothetical protein PHMEG_00014267 [Phytophthora megakarya]|uniref:Uncharacterized protein n=1 Tax=Phytophthora megakarya TaxID=4795 RepID=A0A225W474_9STRA|nr:hypothetical protein PHMEG_00014267 [Phytophthora megakarya]